MKDEQYMSRCIQLALNGIGTTYPNPMVGSVVVHNNRIIGEGWHQRAGEPHAEVHAINSVKDKSLLKDACIYVSLEPCNHFGKTPPCSQLITNSGIKKVIIGTIDPFSEVAGKGIEHLRKHGCEVKVGILEKECQTLNKRFFTFHTKKRPYIILKWAESLDQFIAPAQKETRTPVWITHKHSKIRVHQQRAEEQAILVGTHTVIADNPSLSTRHVHGTNPTRIIIDLTEKLNKDTHHILDLQQKTIIVTRNRTEEVHENLNYTAIPSSKNLLNELLKILYKRNIQSLIVEGGSITLQHFINQNLWDEAFVYRGKTLFQKGVNAPKLPSKKTLISSESIDNDLLNIYTNND